MSTACGSGLRCSSTGVPTTTTSVSATRWNRVLWFAASLWPGLSRAPLGRLFAMRHHAGPHEVYRGGVGIEQRHAEPGIGEDQAQGEPNMAATAQNDHVARQGRTHRHRLSTAGPPHQHEVAAPEKPCRDNSGTNSPEGCAERGRTRTYRQVNVAEGAGWMPSPRAYVTVRSERCPSIGPRTGVGRRRRRSRNRAPQGPQG